MTLFPHGEQPGLWVNRAWRPGTPGTFALVIGVSDYAKLDTSLESLRLGKLPVSALSAFRFFEWLEQDYFVTGCPLAMCWLLLAPTKEELQLAPRMAEAPLNPEYDFCYKAIHAWFDVTLSENSSGILREAMQLWWRSEKGVLTFPDLQTSLLQTPFAELHSGIERSRISALAAMITASTFIRTAQWELLGSWSRSPSGVTSKAANGGHFKTGQRNVAWD